MEGPVRGPAAGPGLHCAQYSWQAWARGRAPPSAAGILWTKLLLRIREEALHFVSVDGGGTKWGGQDILNRNVKAQTWNFFVVSYRKNVTLNTNMRLSLRIKECNSSAFKLKYKCIKGIIVYKLKKDTIGCFLPSKRIIKLELAQIPDSSSWLSTPGISSSRFLEMASSQTFYSPVDCILHLECQTSSLCPSEITDDLPLSSQTHWCQGKLTLFCVLFWIPSVLCNILLEVK